jgi:hypothetical protein
MMPEKPRSPLQAKEIDGPADTAGERNKADDARPALLLANTFGLGRLWRDLLRGGA